jgi:transmembrane sensor
MEPTDRKKLNSQIYDEASDWFVEFRTGDVDTAGRKRFSTWLRTSPEHVRAYLELAAIWNEGPRLDPEHKFDGPALAEDNIVPLGISHSQPLASRAEGGGRLLGRVALAASIAVIAIGGVWKYTQRGVYSTDIGEQRSITLSDGSHIELNANSRIRESFSGSERRIELVRGQALFHVAKDAARPFIVKSDGTQVRAVGTQFDVYRRSTGTTVTVVEGRVAVLRPPESLGPGAVSPSPVIPESIPDRPSPRARATGGEVPPASGEAAHTPIEARPGEFLLTAGEQAIVTAQTAIKPAQPNIAAATAWTQRRLVFESAKLADVAEEFNRYNQHRLIIRSPELNEFRITGIFSSTDPAALIRFLQARPGIAVTEGKDEIVITRAL